MTAPAAATTPAATETASPPETKAKVPWLCGEVVPRTSPSPPWERCDYIALAITFVVTLGVYIGTMAPSVTLEDSGELITGAAHFGVPHPPGYPMWTIFGWIISQIVPIGNLAWRINLESALFAALANGLLAGTCSHVGRWLFAEMMPHKPHVLRMICFHSGLTAGMVLGFSDVMWSQAVIAEVYTLNAFFLVVVLMCYSRWMMATDYNGWLVASVFWFALGLTNHHTLLLIVPAFLVGCLMGNVRSFPSVLCAFIYYVGSVLGVLAWLSADTEMHAIAWRSMFVSFIVISGIAVWYTRRWNKVYLILGALAVSAVFFVGSAWIGGWFRINLTSNSMVVFVLLGALSGAVVLNSLLNSRLIIAIIIVGWMGILPYAYMPFASATNPPMNWGYASELNGFYRDITRGQYDGALDVMIKGILAKPLRVPLAYPRPQKDGPADPTGVLLPAKVLYFYALGLEDGIQLVLAVSAFFTALIVQSVSLQRKIYLLFLVLAFFFGAFMINIIYPPSDFSRDLLEQAKVFNLQSHSVYILFVGYGLACAMIYILWQEPRTPLWSFAGCVFLALLPFMQNIKEHSQANHWFGYIFGYYGLKNADKNAVVYGGTDAGRFVPTYMIFCESTQPDKYKTVRDFDRSDLYIITQNSLADINYIRYIRSQYDERYKPREYSSFAKWLGREKQYPTPSLKTITDIDYEDCRQEWERTRGNMSDLGSMFHWNGILAKRIFEANKHKHTFYVEEMYNIPWMQDYLLPDGLFMKLNKEPMKEMPKDVVLADRKFWNGMTAALLSIPEFHDDPVAQKVFSKLRWSIGNIYYYRKMFDEARIAYEQAYSLAPRSGETVGVYVTFLTERRDFAKAEQVLKEMTAYDPYSAFFRHRYEYVAQRHGMEKQLRKLEKQYAAEPANSVVLRELVMLYSQTGDVAGLEKIVPALAEEKSIVAQEMVNLMEQFRLLNRNDLALLFLELRSLKYPNDGDVVYNLAATYAVQNQPDKAIPTLRRALAIDRNFVLQNSPTDPRFESLLEDPRYRELVPSSDTNAPTGSPAGTTVRPRGSLYTPESGSNSDSKSAPLPATGGAPASTGATPSTGGVPKSLDVKDFTSNFMSTP
ncbi:hypothetical protein DB346_21630 [Verrucomicrobia bacterium LW23]|nr:hypothetical protein DB346_21630 [Verrucomicrobia bacterium LW23]